MSKQEKLLPSPEDALTFQRAFRHLWVSVRAGIGQRIEQEIGYRFTDFPLLFMIHRGICYPGEIKKQTHVSNSMISHMIDRSLKHGLIRRELDPQDSRRFKLSLTGSGERLIEIVQQTYYELVVAAGIQQQELEITTRVLNRLVSQINGDEHD